MRNGSRWTSAQTCPRRRDPGPIAVEEVRRTRELEANVVSELTLKRRRHLRHERQRLSLVLDGEMNEHLRSEILDRPDLRPQGAIADTQSLRAEPDRDFAGGVRECG